MDANFGNIIRFTAGATLTFDTTANLRTGWLIEVWANGGNVLIDPANSDTINGATTFPLFRGQKAIIFKNSANSFIAGVYGDPCPGRLQQATSTASIFPAIR